MSNYPEHEKLSAVREHSQAIGEFLEWLSQAEGISLCHWRNYGTNGEPRYVGPDHPRRQELNPRGLQFVANPDFEEWEEGFQPDPRNVQQLLADYFGVDLRRLDTEKRAMLDGLREKTEQAQPEATAAK